MLCFCLWWSALSGDSEQGERCSPNGVCGRYLANDRIIFYKLGDLSQGQSTYENEKIPDFQSKSDMTTLLTLVCTANLIQIQPEIGTVRMQTTMNPFSSFTAQRSPTRVLLRRKRVYSYAPDWYEQSLCQPNLIELMVLPF
jgi:hypothetical protein